MVDGERVASLLTTENLEFTIRTVTVREEYNIGDIVIKENGVSIPSAYEQNAGMNTDFGTLVFQKQWTPCQWKRIRDITTTRLPISGWGGLG